MKSIRKQLEEMAEEPYRVFQAALLPEGTPLLGVRLPRLRALAKELAKGDWQAYLAAASSDSFEETMLQGMVIGTIRTDSDTKFQAIRLFVPKIDNWSVCDSFCSGLKFVRTEKERTWAFLQPYFASDEEFAVRFAVVMLIDYYVEEAYLEQALSVLSMVHHPGYYVKMAVAWAVSMYYVAFPVRVENYLTDHCPLDDFTYNKALQKIVESRCVDAETKKRMRFMKRKGRAR